MMIWAKIFNHLVFITLAIVSCYNIRQFNVWTAFLLASVDIMNEITNGFQAVIDVPEIRDFAQVKSTF